MTKSDRIDIDKKKLHIRRVVSEDSGMYSCLAKNKAGSSPKMESYPLIVTGNDTAVIKVVPRNLIAKRGEPAVLHCVFEDADSIGWYFKDIGPLETDDERTVLDNGTLVIRSAGHGDQGFYSCHGERGDTSVAYTVELQIACEYLRSRRANLVRSREIQTSSFSSRRVRSLAERSRIIARGSLERGKILWNFQRIDPRSSYTYRRKIEQKRIVARSP